MKSIHEALNILQKHSPYFDPWAMAGSRYAKTRAQVMTLLCGAKRTQAQSGVTALRAKLFELSGAEGECLAEQERNMAQWATEETTK